MEQSATKYAEIAVVGGDGSLSAAVEEAGGTVVNVDAAEPAAAASEADVVVTVDESAFIDVACSIPEIPILPVGLSDAHHAVSKPNAAAAIPALIEGACRTEQHPVLGVDVDGDNAGRAVLDVTLVTGEPARISEFTVESREERLDEFRADAVVVATPVGSDGYAGSAGGSVLAAGTGLVIAPVAPFTTLTGTWVVPDAATLTVARDDEPVDLVLDDANQGEIPPFEPIDVGVDGWIELLRVENDE